MEEKVKTEFFEKIEEAINQYGGTFTIYDTIDLQLARKPKGLYLLGQNSGLFVKG